MLCCQCILLSHLHPLQQQPIITVALYEHSSKDKIKQKQVAKHNTSIPVRLLNN